MHIGVDFDDVLYPYHEHLKKRILKRYGIDLQGTKVTTFYYENLPVFRDRGISRAEVWEEVQAAWDEVESHAQAPLLDADAAPVLRDLAKKHRVTVITARHGDPRGTLSRFLERHGIKPHDVQIGKHEKTGFDALVDDFPTHALQNARSGGYGLLYTIDENSTFDDSRHPRVIRVDNWAEVRDTIEWIAKRRPSIA